MKRLIALFFCIAAIGASAADIVTYRLWITTAPTNGQTITWADNSTATARTWADTVAAAATQIQTTNDAPDVAATNLYTHFTTYPFSGVTVSYGSSTQVVFTGNPGRDFRIEPSAGWATAIRYTTPENRVEEKDATTIHLKGASILKIGPSATIKGEAGDWTITNPQLLSVARAAVNGIATNAQPANQYLTNLANGNGLTNFDLRGFRTTYLASNLAFKTTGFPPTQNTFTANATQYGLVTMPMGTNKVYITNSWCSTNATVIAMIGTPSAATNIYAIPGNNLITIGIVTENDNTGPATNCLISWLLFRP